MVSKLLFLGFVEGRVNDGLEIEMSGEEDDIMMIELVVDGIRELVVEESRIDVRISVNKINDESVVSIVGVNVVVFGEEDVGVVGIGLILILDGGIDGVGCDGEE